MSVVIKPKTFAEQAKKYHPKKAAVLAVKHEGPSVNVVGVHGSEIAHDGDYIVQVGDAERVQVVPPKYDKEGRQTLPGEQRVMKEPVFNVMSAEDFDALYTA
jgi:hypothetical protein